VLRGSFIETGIEIFDRSLPMFRNSRLQSVLSVSGAAAGSLERRRDNSMYLSSSVIIKTPHYDNKQQALVYMY